MIDSVIPESARGGYPWFDRPFDRLTVLSKVEGLTTLSQVEGESRTSERTLDVGSRLRRVRHDDYWSFW